MAFATDRTQGKVLVVAAASTSSVWETVETTLRGCNIQVRKAPTGEEALSRLRRMHYDAVLLDLDLPGMGGVGTCTRVRNEFPNIQIIVVAIQDSVEDRVEALNAGADHFITKPFHTQEFIAQIRAAVRRLRVSANRTDAPIVVGDFHLDVAKRVVEKDGREIRLTATEFNLLYQLMASAGRPILHSVLLDIVWGNHTDKERGYLRIYISQLRKKLEAIPTEPRFLLTYSSVGYVFANPK